MRLRSYAGALIARRPTRRLPLQCQCDGRDGRLGYCVPSTDSHPTRCPDCTQAAVQEAAKLAAAAYGVPIAGLEDFHCAGDFAYADADMGSKATSTRSRYSSRPAELDGSR